MIFTLPQKVMPPIRQSEGYVPELGKSSLGLAPKKILCKCGMNTEAGCAAWDTFAAGMSFTRR
jgi:hypothetical protein